MPEYQTDHLAASYALSQAATPGELREMLLASMMGLARASVGLLFGRAYTGEFVQLGVMPAALDIKLPEPDQAAREQHPVAAFFSVQTPLLEGNDSRLAQARLSLFDIPGRLLVIPVSQAEGQQTDLFFILLLPLVVGPSSSDIARLVAFGQHGARMNRLFLQVQTEGVARRDLSRALDHADQDRARVLNKTLPGLLAGRLVGRAQITQDLRQDIAKFGQSRLPVLITGETGTGKELVAHEIHRISDRNDKPFIAINVAALPADLLESELFGHVRGAFTGATGSRKGLIAEADKGTLFLDEIGDMPLPLQAKLLRVLQEKRFRPVGADKESTSDFRLIAATHRDLPQVIEAGSFRRDLFYRIAAVHLTIAPLRERLDDIPSLAAHFLTEIAQREDSAVKILSEEAVSALRQQTFPGNIRELQSLIERGAVMAADSQVVEPLHLDMPASLVEAKDQAPVSRLLASDGLLGARGRFERFLLLDALLAANGNRQAAAMRLGIPARTLNSKLQADGTNEELFSLAIASGLDPRLAGRNGDEVIDLKAACDDFERQLILDVHGATGGDRRRMVEQLRISLGTLAEKLKRYDIPTPHASQGQSK